MSSSQQVAGAALAAAHADGLLALVQRVARGAAGVAMIASMVSLVGCAHPINVEPDLARLPQAASPLPVKVALHVPADLLNAEFTTAGGGGDSVRYRPYAAMLQGYRRVLDQVFQSVEPVPGSLAAPGAGPDYVLTPSIVTNSGGSNFFTWPPESFTVDLTTNIRDRSGRVVAAPRVVGVGAATTSERIGDHGYSGRRAFEDALRKLDAALREWGRSAGSASTPVSAPRASVAERLRQLKDLHDRQLISDAEYEAKRSSVMADL